MAAEPYDIVVGRNPQRLDDAVAQVRAAGQGREPGRFQADYERLDDVQTQGDDMAKWRRPISMLGSIHCTTASPPVRSDRQPGLLDDWGPWVPPYVASSMVGARRASKASRVEMNDRNSSACAWLTSSGADESARESRAVR